MEKLENKEICQKCGGYCCKKSGCDYFTTDFASLKSDYLEEVLKSGRVSIVSIIKFTNDHGKMTLRPFLYLRARNVGRGAIDLLSYKKTCASLEDDGCYFDFENRPSGGKHLVPSSLGKDYCHSNVDLLKEVLKWRSYQNVLRGLVEKFTGMDVFSKLKEDVENLFYDYLTDNNKDVAIEEKKDILGMLPLLKEVYPESYESALERYNQKKEQEDLKSKEQIERILSRMPSNR